MKATTNDSKIKSPSKEIRDRFLDMKSKPAPKGIPKDRK